MASVADFVAAASQSDPVLSGADDKDRDTIKQLEAESEGMAKDLPTLNDKLTPLTYLHSNSPSAADVSLYCHVHPSMINAPASQHPKYPSLLRYFLHIQSLPPVQSTHSSLPNSFPPLSIDLSALPTPPRQAVVPPVKAKKEKKATEGSSAQPEGGVMSTIAARVEAVTGTATLVVGSAVEAVIGSSSTRKDEEGKKEKKEKKEKEKKEKPAKAAPAKEEPSGPMPSMIDMRVGKVLDVKKHPDAESLYVEQIDIGEDEPRTVCSGLVKYMSEDEIRGATVVVICNLKPVAMRGVKSFAMLLCASSKDGKEGGVEFVLPPEGSQPGERVFFEGEQYENAQPETQLNPKKKIFETIQPGFITLDNREAAWIDPDTKSTHRIRTKDGVLKAKSFVGASLS